MALETATYPGQLVATNPTVGDPKSQGDDQLRLIKSTLLNGFAGFAGMIVVTGTEAQGTTANDYTVTLSPAPAAYTTGALVVFKATHANTGAATLQINALGTKTLSDANGNALNAGAIASGALCIAYYDGTKFYVVSSNGLQTVPTPTAGDNSQRIPNTAYLVSNFAPKDSPAFTGNATFANASGTTPALGDNTTKFATTEYVMRIAFASLTLAVLQGQSITADSQAFTDVAAYRSEYVTGPASSLYTLPDARTLNIGFCYEIYATNAFNLMANDGGYFGSSLVPAGLTRLWLLDNTTQAGTWAFTPAVTLTTLSKTTLVSTTTVVTSSLTTANPQVAEVIIDTTRTLLLYSTTRSASATSGIWAVIVTASIPSTVGRPSISVGTPVQLSGGANIGTNAVANFVSVCAVDAEKYAVAWMEQNSTPTNTPKTCLIQTSGSTITVGGVYDLRAGTATATTGNVGPAVSICSHTTGAYVASYYDAANQTIYARVCTATALALSFGTEYTVKTTINGTNCPCLLSAVLDSNTVAFAFAYDIGTTNSVHVAAAVVVGTALSVGVSVSMGSGGAVGLTRGLAVLSSSSGIVLGAGTVAAFTVSANTVTMGTGVACGSDARALGVISSTQFLVISNSTTGYNFTVAGTTISTGSPATFTQTAVSVSYTGNGLINGTAIIFPDNVINIATLTRRGTLDATSIYVAAPTAGDRYSLSAYVSGATTLNVRAIVPSYALN